MTDQKLVDIDVSHTPAKVDFNFEQVKAQLQKTVDEHDVIVTEETVKESKSVAADLNKLKKTINDKLVEHAKDLEAPGKKLREYAKELGAICDEGRTKITEQVQKFEDKQKAIARDLLDEYLAVCIAEYSVSPAFQTASIDDLVKLTALTSKGALTKQSKNEVENRVAKDAAAEQKVKLRHAELENKSYRAGLSAPLTPDHVSGIINAPDDEYEKHLEAMISRELEREEVAKKKHQKELQRKHDQEIQEQQRKHEAEKEEAKRQPPEPKSQEEQARIDALPEHDDEQNDPSFAARDEVAPQVTDGDSKIVRIGVTYNIEVKNHVNPADVRMKVLTKLIQFGLKPDVVEVL